MTSLIASVLGYSSAKPGPTTQKGLPASWYSSAKMYQLERRAIFSKRWMLVTHKNRFIKAGDYCTIVEAGFSFFLCLDRNGNIGGFHNICRHRAFPLVHEASGNAKVLSCKYHGWSYGIDGKLAKAPHFDNFVDFDKQKNALLRVHVHIDHLGFVWVNLDANDMPQVQWSDDFLSIDTQERFASFDFSQYTFDHTWNMQGDYNWKTLADNYNECLHCKVAHPDVAGIADITVYRVEGKKSHLQHFTNVTGKKNDKDFTIASTYYFPNSCMTVSPHFFYIMRCVPTSELTCSMEYEVYRHKAASDEEFEFIDALFKRILSEDKHLCNLTQRNLNAGVYVNGQLHPKYEEGPLYFQGLVKKFVMAHRSEEEKLQKEIWPARSLAETSSCTTAELEFCAGLDSEKSKVLAW